MRKTIKQLQERWTPETTAQTLADASPRSPFGRLPSGLWDFRGFGDFDWRLHLQKLGVPESIINDDMKESQLEKLHGLNFEGCDFSQANFACVSLQDCSFTNCLFSNADFYQGAIANCSFLNCRFLRSSFRGTYLGFPSENKGGRTVFNHVVFDKCPFRRTSFGYPFFQNVVFSHCKGSFRFGASSFENVSFVGHYKFLEFCNGWPSRVDEKEYGVVPPNPMRNISFADAEIDFIDCNCQCPLSHVILPKTGRFILLRGYWNCLLEIRAAARNEEGAIKTELLAYCRSHYCDEDRRSPRSRFETQDEYIESLDSLAQRFQPRTISVLSEVFRKYQVSAEELSNPATP